MFQGIWYSAKIENNYKSYYCKYRKFTTVKKKNIVNLKRA